MFQNSFLILFWFNGILRFQWCLKCTREKSGSPMCIGCVFLVNLIRSGVDCKVLFPTTFPRKAFHHQTPSGRPCGAEPETRPRTACCTPTTRYTKSTRSRRRPARARFRFRTEFCVASCGSRIGFLSVRAAAALLF